MCVLQSDWRTLIFSIQTEVVYIKVTVTGCACVGGVVWYIEIMYNTCITVALFFVSSFSFHALFFTVY